MLSGWVGFPAPRFEAAVDVAGVRRPVSPGLQQRQAGLSEEPPLFVVGGGAAHIGVEHQQSTLELFRVLADETGIRWQACCVCGHPF